MNTRSWLVVRFPDGSWSYGGKESDPDYEKCEKYRVDAASPEAAIKKAQAKRSRQRRRDA